MSLPAVVGVHDPRRDMDRARAVATAAATGLGDVVRVGSLTVAGAGVPQRSGSITCLVGGDVFEAAELRARLGLPAGAPPALVVARGYERGREAFLRELRGSYQLILWDDASETALVTQDHLSARAVFHHHDGPVTTFASDVAPLMAVLPRRPAPDADVVPRWITDRALPDGLTLYSGVRRLTMGRALRLGRERASGVRIWEPRYVAPEALEAAEAGARLRAGLERAVQRRLEPDGSTGLLLSGGFDSGVLASTVAPILRERGQQLRTYSTVFPGEPWDESPWIDPVVRELGLCSTQVTVRSGALARALTFQQRFELPQPAPGSILDQPLLDLAREDGQRAVLDGQGGDELFAASPYLLVDLLLRGRWAAARRLVPRYPATGGRVEPWQLRALFGRVVVRGAVPHSVHRMAARRRPSGYERLEWLTPASRRRAEALDDPWAWKQGAWRAPRWWSYLAYLLVGAREASGMQDYLRRRGELAGLESRQPLLLDVDLVELMLRTPPELAFSPDYDRALAREAMRGIVPEAVRLPIAKSNYGPLMHRTLGEHELGGVRRILDRDDAEVGAYVDLGIVRRDLLGRAPAHGEAGWPAWGQRIWALATTELWLRANALGADFAGWAERLRLDPPDVELLARPHQG